MRNLRRATKIPPIPCCLSTLYNPPILQRSITCRHSPSRQPPCSTSTQVSPCPVHLSGYFGRLKKARSKVQTETRDEAQTNTIVNTTNSLNRGLASFLIVWVPAPSLFPCLAHMSFGKLESTVSGGWLPWGFPTIWLSHPIWTNK